MGFGRGQGGTRLFYLTHNKLLAKRSVFSAALTQVITKVSARLPSFVIGQLIHSVVDCINEICPSHVAKHLGYLRLKQLKEMETL